MQLFELFNNFLNKDLATAHRHLDIKVLTLRLFSLNRLHLRSIDLQRYPSISKTWPNRMVCVIYILRTIAI
jgi:hypothetical protein